MTVQNPELSFPITEEGLMNDVFFEWVVAITEAVNNLEPLTTSGSPEGVVTASPGRWCVDTTAGAGSGIYFKETGDGNTGWVLRS